MTTYIAFVPIHTPLDDDIWTPEVPEDTNGPGELGFTSFLGHKLTPAQTEALAARLLDHAATARRAARISA